MLAEFLQKYTQLLIHPFITLFYGLSLFFETSEEGKERKNK